MTIGNIEDSDHPGADGGDTGDTGDTRPGTGDDAGGDSGSDAGRGTAAQGIRLERLGWRPELTEALAELRRELGAPELVPGRVIVELRGILRLATAGGELDARIAGRLHHEGRGADLPAVGDWVAVSPPDAHGGLATVRAVLPRRSVFLRKAAGVRTEEQVVAANVDTVLLVAGLDGDFNRRRLERYLTVAWEGGARPVVLLTKADLHEDPEAAVAEAEEVALGVPVHAVSTLEGTGLEVLEQYLEPGATLALLGSSGVGKSTLVNHLLGEEVQRVAEVRESDRRGRHTTTHRELFALPDGALVIDTPGMRELQVWDVEEGLGAAFEDVDELAAACRFRDCRHGDEPGCAVREAVEEGELPAERLESYRKLQAELDHLATLQDQQLYQAKKRGMKAQHKALRKYYDERS